MFKDYYAILNIEPPVSEREIKKAYRNQAIIWHPDKNPERDTTKFMQDIIEAYIFLKDKEGRERYDQTYFHFKNEKKSSERVDRASSQSAKNEGSTKKSAYEFEFEFTDSILKKWMSNASKQAEKMKDEVIDEFRGAVSESGKSIINYFIYTFLPMILGLLFFKACTG